MNVYILATVYTGVHAIPANGRNFFTFATAVLSAQYDLSYLKYLLSESFRQFHLAIVLLKFSFLVCTQSIRLSCCNNIPKL